ncbi:hypothetical protein [uncultured Halomonas sp.]|uniref:hypothetical protein n=1 Tax=uncultured Halomonas sp. TaxID=173971 RepID=UPI0026250B9A|nr:hypothetical protein [uncultured Halomonas sp.]
MKQQTHRKPLDEREKLRKFRELDDAFAEALRELDDPDARSRIPVGPPVAASRETQESDAVAQEKDFEKRLQALMREHQQSAVQVAELLKLMQRQERIA